MRSTDIIRPREQACQTNSSIGFWGLAGSAALMVATGGIATPVVSPAAAVTIFGLWRWGNIGRRIVVEENGIVGNIDAANPATNF